MPKDFWSVVKNATVNVQSVHLGDVSRAVFKATWGDQDTPKRKHVVFIIAFCRALDNNDVSFEDMTLLHKALCERLAKPEWNVVLKTLLVCHAIYNDNGGPHYDSNNFGYMRALTCLAGHTGHGYHESAIWKEMKNLTKFVDPNTTYYNSQFVQAYGAYLSVKFELVLNAATQNEYKFTMINLHDKTTEVLQGHVLDSMPIDAILQAMKASQRLFTALLNIEIQNDENGLPALLDKGMFYLAKDAFRIYVVLNTIVLHLLDVSPQLNDTQRAVAVDQAQLFMNQNTDFQTWSLVLVKSKFLKQESLPKFDSLPSQLLELLRHPEDAKLSSSSSFNEGNEQGFYHHDDDKNNNDDENVLPFPVDLNGMSLLVQAETPNIAAKQRRVNEQGNKSRPVIPPKKMKKKKSSRQSNIEKAKKPVEEITVVEEDDPWAALANR